MQNSTCLKEDNDFDCAWHGLSCFSNPFQLNDNSVHAPKWVYNEGEEELILKLMRKVSSYMFPLVTLCWYTDSEVGFN